MAASGHFYAAFMEAQLRGSAPVNMASDTLYLALFTGTSNVITALDTAVYLADLTNEVSATGYDAGGKQVANPTVSRAGNAVTLDVDNPANWTAADFSTLRWALYKHTGDAATSPLIAGGEFNGTKTVTGGTLTVSISGSGVGTITCTRPA